MGQYSRLLVGMSFFKDGKGIETVYFDKNINIAHFVLGYTFFVKQDYHKLGELEWDRMQAYSHNLTRFSKLSPIALKGQESKKDFEDILNALT